MREKAFLAITAILLLLPRLGWSEEAALHGIWADLLSSHVEDGIVDYRGFQGDAGLLDDYLDRLDRTDPKSLDEQSRLALYINGYNACTVELILDNFENGRPVESIKDIGGFFKGPWDIEFCRIGGEVLTLDNIEHDIIRPEFQDPRVHFAINCASRSCPPLIDVPYRGEVLDRQLTENTIAFLNDRTYNYLEGKTLHVSRIFKWFPEDFDDDVIGFFLRYAQGDLLAELEKLGKEVDIEYLPYDWSLNNSRLP